MLPTVGIVGKITNKWQKLTKVGKKGNVGKNWPNFAKVGKSLKKLAKVVRSCMKLSEIAKCCQKLA